MSWETQRSGSVLSQKFLFISKSSGDWLGVASHSVIAFPGFLPCEDSNSLLKSGTMVSRFFNKDVLFSLCSLLVEEHVELEVADFETRGLLLRLLRLTTGFSNRDFTSLFLCSFELGCDNLEWDWSRLLRACFVTGLTSGVGGMTSHSMHSDSRLLLIIGPLPGLSEISEYVSSCDVEIISIFLVFLGGGAVLGASSSDCFWKFSEDLPRSGMFSLQLVLSWDWSCGGNSKPWRTDMLWLVSKLWVPSVLDVTSPTPLGQWAKSTTFSRSAFPYSTPILSREFPLRQPSFCISELFSSSVSPSLQEGVLESVVLWGLFRSPTDVSRP